MLGQADGATIFNWPAGVGPRGCGNPIAPDIPFDTFQNKLESIDDTVLPIAARLSAILDFLEPS
jgi:hypothetical protein